MNPTKTEVICAVCADKGLKSTVVHKGGSETMMGVAAYYDTAGRYHVHNPNTRTHKYQCSNGHLWSVEADARRCPAEGCGWPGKPGEG
jgi:hypothetical protein